MFCAIFSTETGLRGVSKHLATFGYSYFIIVSKSQMMAVLCAARVSLQPLRRSLTLVELIRIKF